MAFVNEPVGETGRELIKSLNLATPSGCGGGMFADYFLPLKSRIWTIDHERNLQFFVMGGIGCWDREQPPLTCCLVWEGLPIIIETYSRNKGDNTVGIEENWEIEEIRVPSKLMNVPEEEIIETVKEAFTVYAHRNDANVLSVEFPIVPKIKYLYRADELQ